MANNTVTLILDGSVPLTEFAKGVVGFSDLVSALTEEVADGPVNWVLDDLQYSSAIATARAEGSTNNISRVVMAYAAVGTALETSTPFQYGPKVRRAVDNIIDIGVERVRFETAASDALIPLKGSTIAEVPPVGSPTLQIIRGRKPAFGGIKGRIQTLTTRGGLRFTLFDTHHDKAVSCYFEEGKQNQVRDLWGKLVIVEGMIARDPSNGRPLAIRKVSGINPLAEPQGRQNYELALGAAPSLSDLDAVEAIRRVRDAE